MCQLHFVDIYDQNIMNTLIGERGMRHGYAAKVFKSSRGQFSKTCIGAYAAVALGLFWRQGANFSVGAKIH
jgi:hypothetical protein